MSGEKETEKNPMVLCSYYNAEGGAVPKCGWTGRASTYLAHLKLRHNGKEYKRPKTGL